MGGEAISNLSTLLVANNTTGHGDNVIHPKSPEYDFAVGFTIVLTGLMVLMFVVGVVGNSIVCYVVYQKPAMRSAINLLLATLAMADVLTAVLCMPFATVTLVAEDWILGDIFCQMNGLLYAFLITEATFVLLTISFDRYLIIVRRRETLNPKKAKVYIGLSWVVALAITFPPIFGWGHYQHVSGQIQCTLRFAEQTVKALDLTYGLFYFSLSVVMPFVTMSFCYYSILKTVRRNSTRVQNHPPAPVGVLSTQVHRNGRINIDYSFKTRAFTTIFILYLLFVVCRLGHMMSRLYLLFHGYGKSFPFEADAVILWVTYLNCTIKPVIYYWRINKFREACLDIMPSWCLNPRCFLGRPMRRIRPHAIYEVEKKSNAATAL